MGMFGLAQFFIFEVKLSSNLSSSDILIEI